MATTVTLKPNAIDLSGSTSGTTTLQASAVAGTTTVTLPAATDTLVGKATTDTLTNKTLTSPTMTAPVLGTPASGTVTNLTGTASININGTVGATTPAAGSFTTLSASGAITNTAGTANGVTYLNGSKVLTSGSALTFDGTNLTVPAEVYRTSDTSFLRLAGGNPASTGANVIMFGSTHASAAGRLSLAAVGTGDIISNTISGTHIYQINSAEQMRLTSTGLGIGTSSPAQKLDVVGTVQAAGTHGAGSFNAYIIKNTASAGASGKLSWQGSTGTESWAIAQNQTVGATSLEFNYQGSNKAYFNSSGAFFVAQAGGSTINIGNSSTSSTTGDLIGALDFYSFDTDNVAARSYVRSYFTDTFGRDSYLTFGTTTTGGNALERMRIDNAGNLGLGVTPSAWGTSFLAQQIGYSGAFMASKSAPTFYILNNVYHNGTDYIYTNTGAATSYASVSGQHRWFNAPSGTAGDPISFTQAMTLDASGNLLVGVASGTFNTISKSVSLGNAVALIGSTYYGAVTDYPTAYFTSVTASSWNGAAVAFYIANNSTTGRSINASGTINASGADYAEYERNNGLDIAKGDVVGFKADGTLTLTFSEAIRFGIKSTNPSYVGGDTWGSDDALGVAKPTYQSDDFDELLEAARAKVDRIAYSGKVPCNVTGATPGGYIIAVENAGAIAGEFVADPDFAQYKKAVGRVNRILPDSRAEVAIIIH